MGTKGTRAVTKAYLYDPAVDITPLVDITEGLTAAYLKELAAVQLRYHSMDQVVALTQRMQKLFSDTGCADEPTETPPS